MTFTFRLCAFVVIAVASVFVWHWTATPEDVTHLAVQQFRSDGSVAEKLRDATALQNWWPLVLPALVVAIGVAMFWDDVERLWKSDSV